MLVLMKYVEMNEYIQKKTAIRGDVSSSLSSMRKLTCGGLNFLDKVGFVNIITDRLDLVFQLTVVVVRQPFQDGILGFEIAWHRL